MRTLFYSDVHSNLEALQSVLADAAGHGYDASICLGDIVGYGADPRDCVDIVSKIPGGAAVLGNHDAAVIDPSLRAYLNPAAQAGVSYSESKLALEEIGYLRSLPLLIDGGGDYVATHSSPYKPEQWFYVLETAEAREAIGALTRSVAFIGHTHFPAVHNDRGAARPLLPGRPVSIRPGDKWIVNVGSVGQPRDGDPRAAYVIYDDATGVAELFRVEYDVDTAARKILEAGLPAMLADRLRLGY